MEASAKIHCPACGGESHPDRRFCTACGARLGAACPACGAASGPGEVFCGDCGTSLAAPVRPASPPSYTPRHLAERILAARSALEGERKQVTVLFADVKGSMDLAEQLDPEEWHRLMDRFLHLLAEGVHRFEGTVNQYTGDGIMALFGAPIAHEDHAQRACWAALRLRDTLREYAEELKRTHGIPFSVRMGLNSGEVVVGRIGDDLRMDYTAQGHVVGLAQRMEQLAGADRVYLTEHTAALVGGYFRLRDLGPFAIKGVREALHVHELEGAGAFRTRLDVSRARGFSRFVGRREEMGALEGALARALEGNGQVVGVVAEPGVGKSRLCHEFVEGCRVRGIPVYRGHCVAHGRFLPLLPIVELLREIFGIEPDDAELEARRKIAGTLVLLAEDVRGMLPLVFDLMGVPDPEQPAPALEPDDRQRRLFEFVRRMARARSAREPALLFLDDLHWIDAASDLYLANWVEGIRGTRTLVLVNFRPEYRAPWMASSFYQQLPLHPLGAEAVDELLDHLLGTDPSLKPLRALVQERTGGNPFFVEEIVRVLAESGALEGGRGAYRLAAPVSTLAMPPSVQAVLAARIDRLPEREKGVLETAAVIGRTASEPLLARVTGLPPAELTAALAGLVERELLYEEALYPEAEYAFKHPLTREVAYTSQLAERRQRTHAAAAQAIIALDAARLDERAALVAHHFENAGAALEAAEWYSRAGSATRDVASAVAHLRRALHLLRGPVDSERADALMTSISIRAIFLGGFAGLPSDELERMYVAGRAAADRLGNLRARAFLGIRYHNAMVWRGGSAEEALARAAEAERLAASTGDRELRHASLSTVCLVNYVTGRVREQVRATDELLAALGDDIRVQVGGFFFYHSMLFLRTSALALAGRVADAERSWDRVLHVATELQPLTPGALVLTHAMRAWLAEFTDGERTDAVAHGLRALELFEREGGGWLVRLIVLQGLARVYLACGRWEEALKVAERAGADDRESGMAHVFSSVSDLLTARALLGLGEVERARALVTEAIAAAQSQGTLWVELEARITRVRVLARLGGAEALAEARADLARAAALVEETGARAFEPRVHEALAEVAAADGDLSARERALRAAERLYAEMGLATEAERVADALASSHGR